MPKGFLTGGSLYNNSQNLPGTGTTIVDLRGGEQTLFFQAPAGSGLTTGLAVLKAGFVIVGNMPTTGGTAAT